MPEDVRKITWEVFEGRASVFAIMCNNETEKKDDTKVEKRRRSRNRETCRIYSKLSTPRNNASTTPEYRY